MNPFDKKDFDGKCTIINDGGDRILIPGCVSMIHRDIEDLPDCCTCYDDDTDFLKHKIAESKALKIMLSVTPYIDDIEVQIEIRDRIIQVINE